MAGSASVRKGRRRGLLFFATIHFVAVVMVLGVVALGTFTDDADRQPVSDATVDGMMTCLTWPVGSVVRFLDMRSWNVDWYWSFACFYFLLALNSVAWVAVFRVAWRSIVRARREPVRE